MGNHKQQGDFGGAVEQGTGGTGALWRWRG